MEWAQYCFNRETYDPDAFAMDGFRGSLVEYIIKETEKLHARVCLFKLESPNRNGKMENISWIYFYNLVMVF